MARRDAAEDTPEGRMTDTFSRCSESFSLDPLDAAEVRALHAELQQRQAELALAHERLDLARVAYQARLAQLRKRYSEGGQYEVVGEIDLIARQGQRVRVREGGSEG